MLQLLHNEKTQQRIATNGVVARSAVSRGDGSATPSNMASARTSTGPRTGSLTGPRTGSLTGPLTRLLTDPRTESPAGFSAATLVPPGEDYVGCVEVCALRLVAEVPRDMRTIARTVMWPLTHEWCPGNLSVSGVVCCHVASHLRLMAFGTSDGLVHMCTLSDMSSVTVMRHGEEVLGACASAVCILLCGRVAWAIGANIMVMDSMSTQTTVFVPAKTAAGTLAAVTTMAGLFGGQGLVWGASDGGVRMCLLNMDMPAQRYEPPLDSPVHIVVAAHDDSMVLAVGASGLVRIYCAVTGTRAHDLVLRQAPGDTSAIPHASAAAFAPDSHVCVVGYMDGSLRVWDTVHGTCTATIHPAGNTGGDPCITSVCVLGNSRVNHPEEFDSSAMCGRVAPALGSYRYTGIAAGTATGRVVFWPWYRGHGLVMHSEHSVVAHEYAHRTPVIATAGSTNTLLCMGADGSMAFVAASSDRLPPANFMCMDTEAPGPKLVSGTAVSAAPPVANLEPQLAPGTAVPAAVPATVPAVPSIVPVVPEGGDADAVLRSIRTDQGGTRRMSLVGYVHVDAVLAVSLPSAPSKSLRIVVAHGPAVVQYTERLHMAYVLVGPGSGNGARLFGGVARICASDCGRFLAIFDHGGQMLVFDGCRFAGATALLATYILDMTAAHVYAEADSATVLISTHDRMLVIRPCSPMSDTHLAMKTQVSCIGSCSMGAGAIMYGCVDGTLCRANFGSSTPAGAKAARVKAAGGKAAGGKSVDAESAGANDADAKEKNQSRPSCDVLCRLGGAVTCLAPCTLDGNVCTVVGAANGSILFWHHRLPHKNWLTAVADGAPIKAVSVREDLAVYAAQTEECVYLGSLVRTAVFLQCFRPIVGPILSTRVFLNWNGEAHLALVAYYGRVQTWNIGAAVAASRHGSKDMPQQQNNGEQEDKDEDEDEDAFV